MFSNMGDEGLFWNDDQSWAFPMLPPLDQENGGNILMNMIGGGGPTQERRLTEEEQPVAPPPKGKKKSSGGKRPGGGSTDEVKEGKRGESDDHELHIWTERERRKKMRNMFSCLHDLIPHLHPRADKSTIVDEAVAYIKTLQQSLENLEKLKQKVEAGENANPTGCDVVPQQCQSREAFMAEQGSTSQQPPPPPPPPVTVAAGPNACFSGPETRACFKTWTSPNVVLSVCGNDAQISVVCSGRKPGILSAIVFVMDKYKLDLVSAHVSYDGVTRKYMIHSRAGLVNGDPQQLPEDSFVVDETFKLAVAELMLWAG